MPSPGVVNNPTGQNAYGSDQGEEPYGAIERRKVLSRMAPMTSAPALNAPRRAQAQATKGKQPPPATPVQPAAANQAQVNEALGRRQVEKPEDPTVEFWRQLATEPGASPLVRQYAAQVGAI